MSFVTAVRQNLILLLGFVGKSGSGKTGSALKVARGLVGPKGRIACVDSENRRSCYHADDPSIGGFMVEDLQPPFSPERYREKIEEAQQVADVLVIDNLSHEWNGEGGVLYMIEDWLDKKCGGDYGKRDKLKMAAWGFVGPKHDAMVAAILRSKIPIICCFRAKDKIVMEKKEDEPGQRAKTTIHTDEDAPVQRKDLVHEMTMIFSMEQRDGVGGYYTVRKRTTEGLYQAVSACGDQMKVAHGEALAAWCKAPTAGRAASPAPAGSPAGASGPRVATDVSRKYMIDQLKDIHAKALAYAIDKSIIMPNEGLESWPLEKVPMSKAAIAELRQIILNHQ